MLARRDDKLPCLLHCLVKFGNSLLSNLRCLLKFWQEHYLHKDKDCSTLEKSSLIPFSFWKSTVSILVSDDENSPSSILFYIKVSLYMGVFSLKHTIIFKDDLGKL